MVAELNRKQMRLSGYDYSQPGAYFVTICAQGRRCLFGEIAGGQMRGSATGDMVACCWNEIPQHFRNVELDAFVIMPNHLHGILLLTDVVAGHARPLPVIVGSFKSAVSRQAGFSVWQRSYWERIIRSEPELNEFRRYIDDNPLRWASDEENPSRVVQL